MAAKKTVAAATSRQPEAPPTEYASAMDKIRDEMAKSKDNYVQVVGEYLTDHLLAHPEAEAALLDKGKSIKGSLETVRKEAEKVKQGNMAILDDRTVFGIVLGYFGLKGTGNRDIERQENSPVDCFQRDGAGRPLGTGIAGQAIQKPSPVGEGGSAPALTEEVPVPSPDPFDLDALLGVMG